MTEPTDPRLDETLTETFARRSRAVGPLTGDLADVVRRAHHRRTKRRTLTAMTSIAILAAGVGGLVGLGQLGDDAPARSAGGPSTTVAGPAGAWFVCHGERTDDAGRRRYDWCELETGYANPLWSCTGPIADPAVDGDDRPRFESCSAVGEAFDDNFFCTSGTLVEPAPSIPCFAPPTTAIVGTLPPLPTDPVAPFPSVPTPSLPGSTVPPVPATTAVACTDCGSAPDEQIYAVVAGDSLAGIAERFGIRLDQLLQYNGWTADQVLLVGTVVRIPPGSTPAVEPPRVAAIGDSVMLGASDVLVPRGWTVYADAGLQLADAIPIVEQMATAGVLADTQTVIVHLGTNGPFTADQLDALLEPLSGVPNVLLYTVRADRAWTEPNNALLRSRDQPGDNIALIDWDVRSQECTGDCFAGDGIHLNANGKDFYADLARDWTGQ